MHAALRSRLNPGVKERSISHSNTIESRLYSQKLYNDGKLSKSAVGGSEDHPYQARHPMTQWTRSKYQRGHGAIKNICPPEYLRFGTWIDHVGDDQVSIDSKHYTFDNVPNADSALHSSSGSCLPRGILPASSRLYG